MATTLCQPAGGTPGLVAIDALHTEQRGDRQHRRSGAGRAEHRSHALRCEVISPLRKRLALSRPGGLRKENRTL
jgi:hypothetical protein